MTMKNITKTGLTSFISTKIKVAKDELLLKVKVAIDTKIDPILAEFVDTKKLETLASRFIDEAQNAIEKYGVAMENWQYRSILQDMNRRYISLGSGIKNSIKSEVEAKVKFPTDAFDFKNDDINQAVKELQKEMKLVYKNINDLEVLLSELERAIKNESSASRAYKALLAFGVDMKDYTEAESYLPAIVKLSVNVSILNGNCEEKSA